MLESKIYTVLSQNANIANRVNARIYPLVMPQDPILPAITYQRLSAGFVNDLSGYSVLENPHITINSWATDYATVKAMADEVHTAMNSAATAFRAMLSNELDIYDGDLNLFAVSQDFSCWNRE